MEKENVWNEKDDVSAMLSCTAHMYQIDSVYTKCEPKGLLEYTIICFGIHLPNPDPLELALLSKLYI